MLTIVLQGDELFDEVTNTFTTVNDIVLEFEHSLLSLSKWESEFLKPFLGSESKTPSEVFGYIRAMCLTPHIGPGVLERLTENDFGKINDYIESKESATTFGEMPERKGKGEVITAELIYYWMVAFSIPFECENWHLNRLFALVRICNIKNSKPKTRSRAEIVERNRSLNEQRKAELGTSG